MADIIEAKMKESFDKYDTDKSGYVCAGEIEAVIKDMDPGINEFVLKEIAKVSKLVPWEVRFLILD